ncbi:hypothetical protein [Mycobacterium sp.]|uniref:hypothetical protein n=1 Tax=Mycobacterium sp. TaxID=1785 RepID=UPI0031E32DC0
MMNLSPSARLLAAGAGATLMALLASPLAQADAADAAYGDLATPYTDAAAFSNSFGAYEDLVFDADLSQNFLAAVGLGFGEPFSSGTTASQDLSTLVAEGTTITAQLDALKDFQPASVFAATDGKELPVIGDAVAFQEQINTAVADLPTITAADETNPLLIADLSALYNNELTLGNAVTNLGEELANGSPAGLTADNTNFLAEGLGIVNDLHGTAATLTLLADLTSLGL